MIDNFSPFNSKKILIVSPAWIGDIIIAQALYKYLKHQSTQKIIDILAPRWSRELLSTMPEINKIIDMPIGHSQIQLKKRWEIGESLRSYAYDQAIILPNSWKSAIIPFAARIPLRTGWRGEMRFGLLNDWRILNKKKFPLMVQRFLALGHAANLNDRAIPWQHYRPGLHTSSVHIQKTVTALSLSLSNKPLLILCPGAAYGPAKRWPAAYFAKIANEKHKQGWQICLLGSKSEQSIAESIQKLTNNICIDLVGRTSLRQTIDVLSLAEAVISNDSGLMHCAAALNKPLIALYGSSSPAFTPPLTQRKHLLSLNLACSPCFQRKCPLSHFNCLTQLKPTAVLSALNDLELTH